MRSERAPMADLSDIVARLKLLFLARCGPVARHEGTRLVVGVTLIWLAYLGAVELIARAADAYERQKAPAGTTLDHARRLVRELDAPPLARWDSIYYYAIAKDGYRPTPTSDGNTAAFLPLYPLLMRWLGNFADVGFFSAGLWISRLCLLMALLLLANDARTEGQPALLAPVALLAFPAAFILASAYSESLFLSLSLGAFRLARLRHYSVAAVCAFAASATRIQGLALIPALFVFGYRQRTEAAGTVWCFLPAAACIGAYGSMIGYCAAVFGDPFHHFAIKRELWGQGFTAPWTPLAKAVDDTVNAMGVTDLGSLYVLMQLPCLCLALLAIFMLATDARDRRWWELTFVGGSLAMSLFGGALGGLPRFTLVLFPIFGLLPKLHRLPPLWYVYLMLGCLVQAALVINYVGFQGPPP